MDARKTSDLGNKEILARNLQNYLDLAHKTRNDLAKDLGFKYTTVSNWLQAERYPRIDKIEMMAKYLGIDKSDLIERPSKPKSAAGYCQQIFRKKIKSGKDFSLPPLQSELNHYEKLTAELLRRDSRPPALSCRGRTESRTG